MTFSFFRYNCSAQEERAVPRASCSRYYAVRFAGIDFAGIDFAGIGFGGCQLRKTRIEDQRNYDTVDRAHKERPVQERQRLYQTGEAGEGTAGNAGKDSAHGKGDDTDGGNPGRGEKCSRLPLPTIQ